MAGLADVYTVTAERVMLYGDKETIGIDFDPLIAAAETISTAIGTVVHASTRVAVPAVVTSAQKDGTTVTQVNVALDTTPLTRSTTYLLETRVVLNTGASKGLLMKLVIV